MTTDRVNAAADSCRRRYAQLAPTHDTARDGRQAFRESKRPRYRIAHMTSSEAIRAARAEIDDAIARRDAAAIAAFLLPSYRVVTARSKHRDGREESAESWQRMFERDPGATHASTPVEIHVNEEWGMAEEHGRWEGRVTTSTGPLELAGVYAAKWHFTAEGWRLQAEIFTPLRVARP